MNRIVSRLGFTSLVIIAGAAPAMAQESGTLSVTVKDGSGKPVDSATIVVASPTQIGGTRTVISDANGRARFPLLYPGIFEVKITAKGFLPGHLKNVAVGVGQNTPVEVKLAKVSEATVEVVASAAVIDSQSVTSATRLQLETVEALPTARTYTDYLKLAPGVIASPDAGGNPVVAGSLGRDNTGLGGARNNTYILDGVDTTNPQTGTALSRFNSEIIQEQEIKIGGITADVATRGGGLVSNVITKSGSNEWHGSLNYYFQNDGLVAGVKEGVKTKPSKFNTFDSAFTIGGPILKDNWWFFASLQKINQKTDGAFRDTATPTHVAKNAEQDDVLAFFKTTLQFSVNHKFEVSISDNRSKDTSLGADTSIPGWDFNRDRNQRILNGRYDGSFGDWIVTGKYFNFSSDSKPKPNTNLSNLQIIYPDSSFNGLPASDGVDNYLKQGGGLGWYTENVSKRDGFSVDVTKFTAQLFGEHQFKFGITSQQETRSARLLNSGDGADYENLARGTSNNLTWADVYTEFSGASWADTEYVPHALDLARTSNAALNTYLNGIGDYDNIPFQTLYPGSTNQILQYRIAGLRWGNDAKVKRKSLDYYLQDTWTLPGNVWTVYAGVRFNKDSYYADDGAKLHDTELNVAPRLGATYNHKGENKFKMFATYGRYFEPIKLDMVTFAGSFANARVEQMYIPYLSAPGTYNANNWVTLRQRGGRETVDAAMAPTLQSPYTDEVRLGFEKDLGGGMFFEGTYSHRKDSRIVEDFDLWTYTDPDAVLPSSTTLNRIISVMGGTASYWNNVFRGLAYPLSHFGYTEIPANVNYVLGNMIGAKREFDVFNFTWRLQDTGHGWTAMANYTHTNATGNSLSSGDADFQGDVPRLDPRLPYMNGRLNGSVDNTFKTYLAHTFKNGWAKGLNIGATYTYIQGINYTRGLGLYGRVLQGPFIDGFDGEPGTRKGPDFKQLDLRVKYEFVFAGRYKAEAFVDIFNFQNRQSPSALEESSNGVSGEKFGQPIGWQAPRRFYLGFRFSF